MDHFAIEYAESVSEILHRYMMPTWYYKLQIYEIPGLLTALLVSYDNQDEDEYTSNTEVSYEDFLKRMSKVKPDWKHFKRENFQQLAELPDKTFMGWEGRTFYFIKGGSHPEQWSAENAVRDVLLLLRGSYAMHGPMILAEAKAKTSKLPTGLENYREYEHFVRVTLNYLFNQDLGEFVEQDRTEPGNEGTEIRDLIASNKATSGVFQDLKAKYGCSEILFDAKNKTQITRDDLRQLYCYLKPAIGLWGFIVCRAGQPARIQAYNRTLFKNFVQERGVTIISDKDLVKMIEMKMRGRNPSEYIMEKRSKFIRSI